MRLSRRIINNREEKFSKNKGSGKMNQIKEYKQSTFEDIKYIDESGVEFWYARELQIILDYKEWRKFENVINKAKEACKNSNLTIADHFVGTDKMVTIGSGAKRKQRDYKLSRYACYLIAQNGDSRKSVIALAKHTLQFKRENKKLVKKNIIFLPKTKKDFIKET